MPIIKEDPLRRYNPNEFSFNSFKGEVSEAMQEDWKYHKVDETKKKAIYDTKNYDEFKDRVKGCTLKPIHRNEFNAPPKFAFNRQAPTGTDVGPRPYTGAAAGGATASRNQGAVGDSALSSAAAAASQMRTGREFERELRRRPKAEERVALLSGLDGDACARLFGRELDAEVLRQLLVALDEAGHLAPPPGRLARRFLALLAAHCPSSTATAASFFTADERSLIARLLAREEAIDMGEEDARLCAPLGVPPASVVAAAADLAKQQEDARLCAPLGVPPASVPAAAADLAKQQEGVAGCPSAGGFAAGVETTACGGEVDICVPSAAASCASDDARHAGVCSMDSQSATSGAVPQHWNSCEEMD